MGGQAEGNGHLGVAGSRPLAVGVTRPPCLHALYMGVAAEMVTVSTLPSRLADPAPHFLAERSGTVSLVARRLRVRQEPLAAVRALALPSLHGHPLTEGA